MSSTKTPAPGQDLDIGEMYTSTELFFDKHKKAVSIAAIAVVVVVAGFFGYRKFVAEPKATEAAELIWKAQYWFEIDSLDLAINGDGNYFGFQHIADNYGSTPSGELANFYLGVCYHQKGEFETALNFYKQADLGDDILRVMVVGNQGDVLVELGRNDEAVAQFDKAADMVRSDYTTPMFLMKAGILHQQMGDFKNAAKCFARIGTEFPTSPDAQQAKKYAARAKAMSGQS
ncbi:MAG: tetratricopeptide repeat protein [Flavobacteriales bacterium]|nr:tetratricopeptide repeat protein [Flavobacteriales bacterium]